MPTKTKTVSPNQFPEVKEFMEVQNELDTFRAKHAATFRKYAELAERYNAMLEAAEQRVRAEGVSCGPFEHFSTQVRYDAEKMIEELGEELFFKCGGKATKVIKYEIDRKLVEAAIARKQIEPESVEAFRKEIPNYHKPDKISL